MLFIMGRADDTPGSTHSTAGSDIRPPYPRKWEPSEPLVAYNSADSTLAAAA